ncbi:MAG TPA: hypothetical protein VED84_03825 [Acidimicrobiales bacterium]|nr:hypothetical protein [Acidimicrobiales bacterium]
MRRIFAPLLVAFLVVGASAAAVSSAGPPGADITRGTPSEVAGSLNIGGDAHISSISCPSDGNCVAGGDYLDGSKHEQAFVVDEVNGVWKPASEVAGLFNTGGHAQINSISCPSDGDCIAAGSYSEGPGQFQAFVVDEVGGVWKPAGKVAASLNTAGLAATQSVSCPSDGNCVAGGSYRDGSQHFQAFLVDEVEGVWKPPREVAGSLNAGGYAQINSVSCPSDGNCGAGGYYTDGFKHQQAFFVDEVGGVWKSPREIAGSLNAGSYAQINSVSCPSDDNCGAAGSFTDSFGHSQAFVVDEVGGVWKPAREVAGSLNTGGIAGISSVSCPSDGNCVVGGSYRDGSGHFQAFVVDEVEDVWTPSREIAGSLNTGGYAQINSVSCPPDGDCVVGGSATDGSGHTQAFVVDKIGDVWKPAREVARSLNTGDDAWTQSISCPPDGNCVAGGYYTDSSNHQQAFVVNDGRSLPPAPSPSAPTSGRGP